VIDDSSALIALLLREPAWERLAHALAVSHRAAIGAPTLTETAIVLHTKGAPPSSLPALLQRLRLRIVSFMERHAIVAAVAYATYGRGRHPASLDVGDCMTYAIAGVADAPLLFLGDGFSSTDLTPASG
jgi:ribonuclease VapC